MRITAACLITLCVVQNATSAEVEVPVLRGSQTYEPAPPVAVQPGPVFVRQTNRFLQQGIFLEFGTRYWFSTGTFSKDLSFDPSPRVQNPGVISRLSYKNLTAHSLELYGSVKQIDALFLKWNAGLGKITSGSLIDEDFSLPVPDFPTSYSRTTSNQGDGSLGFATIDLGYNFVGWTNFQMGGFIGYNFLRETVNAVGCAQQAGNPNVCVPPIATSTPVVTERADWSSFRVGVAVDWLPLNRLKLSGNFAWVPFTSLAATDTHTLRVGTTAETAHGSGVQLDALASYAFTDSFNVGLGLRYWYLRANGERDLTSIAGFIQPESFKSQRFGVFLQGAYTFGVPGKMHRPQWLSCC